jgi:eukaryotic-like serine/threonine-protein kinase
VTPERYQQVGRLYREALARPPAQRSSFLFTACNGDVSLQREVESLLRYDTDGDTMIDGFALQVLGETLGAQQSQSWVGRQVSHYRILSMLGYGGMGEVYRARDTRLARDVAVKALSLVYSADPMRLGRFEQEAQAAGKLNHPNVLAVYDIGVHEGAPYIVTELLEGEDLRQQLHDGALPHRRAIDYARQIASGLAATHAKGIIHRDLKPENLFVTSDGRVKILDFGLAKLTAPSGNEAMSPSRRLGTSPGLIIGTIGYLSPEQLRGEQPDQRADMFAFGVILYEMLTGRRPFERGSPADITAAILKEEPPDLNEPRRVIPPAVDKIVRRCLEKNPAHRFQSASDLGFALEVLSPMSHAWRGALSDLISRNRGIAGGRPERRILRAVTALVGVLGTVSYGFVVWNARSVAPRPAGPIARFVLPVQTGAIAAGDLEMSPDGAYLAYSTGRPGAKTLSLYSLADPDVALARIDDGDGPFFSPDSQWLGFFAHGKMKKISVRGGTAVTIADAPSNRGADWGEHGSIVFAPIARAGLLTVAATGGVPEILTTPDSEQGETSHVRPRWLPGSQAVVYVARGEAQTNRKVMAFSLKDGQPQVLLDGDEIPKYMPTGHLVFIHQGRLMAAPFDLERLEVTGTPMPIMEGVATYGLSNAGSLIYAPNVASAATKAVLVWVNRNGQTEPLNAPPNDYSNPRLSPDGRRIALTMRAGGDDNIWLYDTARDALTRLTFEGRNGWPVWSHDGRQVIYAKPADGAAAEEALLVKPLIQVGHSLSRDGRLLALTEVSTSAFQTSLLSVPERHVSVMMTNGWSPSLSPDGRWVAYTSNDAGRYAVYVRPTSGAAGKWLISSDGGVEPLWSPNGSEIFYRLGEKVFAVAVATHGGFQHGKPHVLFEGHFRLDDQKDPVRSYDVTFDGQRFLMIRDEIEPATNQLQVVVNWIHDLDRSAAARK